MSLPINVPYAKSVIWSILCLTICSDSERIVELVRSEILERDLPEQFTPSHQLHKVKFLMTNSNERQPIFIACKSLTFYGCETIHFYEDCSRSGAIRGVHRYVAVLSKENTNPVPFILEVPVYSIFELIFDRETNLFIITVNIWLGAHLDHTVIE